MMISAKVLDKFLHRISGRNWALDYVNWRFVGYSGYMDHPWCVGKVDMSGCDGDGKQNCGLCVTESGTIFHADLSARLLRRLDLGDFTWLRHLLCHLHPIWLPQFGKAAVRFSLVWQTYSSFFLLI